MNHLHHQERRRLDKREMTQTAMIISLVVFFSQLGFHMQNGHVMMYPMAWHGILLACFSSLIAPFGGFFASGFKRAFKVKVRYVITLYCLALFE